MDRDRDIDSRMQRPQEPGVGRPQRAEPAAGTPRRLTVEDILRVGELRWEFIWAGVLATFAVLLLLELLVLGIGLISATDRPGEAGNEDWVSWIIGVIAFFVGGYVTIIMAAPQDRRAGLIDGLLVWALGSVLILTLSALGLGQLFGALGDVVGQAHALGDPSTTIEPSQLTNTIKSSALGAFLSLLTWALASVVGARLGSSRS